MNAPFAVSAVIPARDALPHVLEAVESVLDQNLPAAEIVVVDDASRDGTGDAVESRFGARAASAGVALRVVRGTFGSAAAARNAGWRAATAAWIAFLDADDLWFPDKLAVAAETTSTVPEAAWFFSDGAFRDRAGVLHASWLELYADLPPLYAGSPIAELIEVNFILTSSVVARKDLLTRLGGFDPTMSHGEDLDLWIRLARAAPAAAARRSLVRYQHLEGGLSSRIEARLQGDVTLFQRLASDPALDARLRRSARRREALAHYKLAFQSLRSGEGAAARRALSGAWLFPERALPVAGAWLTSWLPAAWIERLRGQSWATRGLASPTLSQARVLLRAEPRLIGALEGMEVT